MNSVTTQVLQALLRRPDLQLLAVSLYLDIDPAATNVEIGRNLGIRATKVAVLRAEALGIPTRRHCPHRREPVQPSNQLELTRDTSNSKTDGTANSGDGWRQNARSQPATKPSPLGNGWYNTTAPRLSQLIGQSSTATALSLLTRLTRLTGPASSSAPVSFNNRFGGNVTKERRQTPF